MIQQIKSTGGNWPAKNETLIKNYVNFIVKAVKSIKFTDFKLQLTKLRLCKACNITV